MPHWMENTPLKITRLKADSARPAWAGAKAWPNAGWLTETKVQAAHQAAQCQAPAAGPSAMLMNSRPRHSGRPRAISQTAEIPRRARRGIKAPQAMKASSMARLMMNRPCAACPADAPPTRVIQGPAHSACTAIRPP